MSSKEDVQFLALLVHRGYLERGNAEPLLKRMQQGIDLDTLLTEVMGWDEKKIRKLRRTRAGEDPQIPGYEIVGRLGVGGTAEVFRAHEKKGGGSMALKILNARCTAQPEQLKAFVSESRLLEKLDHPGLIKGYGVARSGDTYFARLELVEGQTLLEHLDDGHIFEESAALRIILESAEVLAYMASQNLVHRDVKPGNIMLTQNGKVKLIDLGFCVAKDECSQADSAVGTVQYLSPEQAQGGAQADFRSDIYSLGLTLFQLVVGRLPFEADDDQEVLRMQIMNDLSSPELKQRGLSPHLHYFIHKMVAKDAEDRYQSWQELIEDIQTQLAGRADLDYGKDARDAAPARTKRIPRRQVGGRRSNTRRR